MVIGNYIVNCNVGGIRHGKIIANNYLDKVSNGAKEWPGISGPDVDGIIVGNYLRDIKNVGINGYGSSVVIANNRITNSYYEGIFVNKSRTIVEGNIITNPATATFAVYNAIKVTSIGTYTVIKGNIIHDAPGHGIYLDGADHCLIEGNLLTNIGNRTNNTYSAIFLTSTSTHNIIRNNKIYSDADNKPKYGIAENSSDDDFNIIFDNDIAGIITKAILW